MKDYRNELGFKLRIVHNSIDKYFDKYKSDHGGKIPRGQQMTLHYLMDNADKPVYQKDIENYFSLSGATVTNMLKSLEKNNYIQRIQSSKDARLKQIVLTDKALERENKVRATIDRLEDGLKKDFTSEELTRFRGYLDKLIQNLDEMNNLD